MASGPEPARNNIPYRDHGVTFIKWLPNKAIETSNEVGKKREWLAEECPLFAAWNGLRRTDVFLVDRRAARKALA
jgi:hypothetical protein